MTFNRVKQWATFARVWYLFDAKWQDANQAGKVIAFYLMGKHKPIYQPDADSGDHVVVINSRDISLPKDTWRTFMFHHHTGYAGGFSSTPAWKFHEQDPTKIIWIATRSAMARNSARRYALARLHVFPDDKLPESIMENVSDQIRVPGAVPRRLSEHSAEEINNFPKLFDWPEDYTLNRGQHDPKRIAAMKKKAK